MRSHLVLGAVGAAFIVIAGASAITGGRGVARQGGFCAGSGTSASCSTGATASRMIEDKLRDTVNVKDFGAVGDGSTDDTAAIQAAIDSLAVGVVTTIETNSPLVETGEQIVLGGGGTITFPFGKTFKITGLLVPANVALDLNWSTLKVYGTNAVGIARKHNAGLYADNNIAVRNGYLFSGDGAAGQNGIVLDTVDRTEFTNLHIHGFAVNGLWLKKSQYMVTNKLTVTGDSTNRCGTGVRLEPNSDNYGSHQNKMYQLLVAGCDTCVYLSGFNNSIIGGTVGFCGPTAGIKVESRGSEGTQATQITGISFEGSLNTWDIWNLATHTVVTESMFVVPPTPADKIKRFMRQESGDLLVTNCYSQSVNLSIAGLPAVIEHFGGVTRVNGGNFGVLLKPDQLVVDETGSGSSAKILSGVYVSTRTSRDSGEGAFGVFALRQNSATDTLEIGLATESLPRIDMLSDGRLYLGNGSVLDTIIQRDSSGNLQITPGSTNVVAPAYKVNSTTGGGTITLTSATPSTGTATVLSGHRCVCTNTTTQANPIKCAVSGTTLTATGPNTVTDVVAYFCF